MQFSANYPLKNFNSFQIDVFARLFTSVQSENDLKLLWLSHEFKENNKLILGGGSNILFKSDYDGLIIKNDISGIEIVKETDQHIFVKLGGGENWHKIVLHCLSEKWFGLENLSLIPGTIGAAPIQNIGAYGVELKDVFHELTAFHLDSGKKEIFANKDCEFGYRTSVFKTILKNKIIILDVTLKLSKNPKVNISYHALSAFLKDKDSRNISPKDVSDSVINIRQSKLPDPIKIGNGGSFFKNPVVNKQLAEDILKKYPDLNYYDNQDGTIKIPAAFLIEKCGWKGRRIGDAGVHDLQPLVLVNHGNANGKEIVDLAMKIQHSVMENFHIKLEPEVNII